MGLANADRGKAVERGDAQHGVGADYQAGHLAPPDVHRVDARIRRHDTIRSRELQAIAACVIGGVSLTGGRGSILGIFLGAMLIHTITDVLLLLRAPGFYLDMFIAVLIVGAAAFNSLIERKGAG